MALALRIFCPTFLVWLRIRQFHFMLLYMWSLSCRVLFVVPVCVSFQNKPSCGIFAHKMSQPLSKAVLSLRTSWVSQVTFHFFPSPQAWLKFLKLAVKTASSAFPLFCHSSAASGQTHTCDTKPGPKRSPLACRRKYLQERTSLQQALWNLKISCLSEWKGEC